MSDVNWLLPEGVEEILPNEAAQLEHLRRTILDDLSARGFQLVMPPVMEFVDSLLVGSGAALDTQTYKFMDQHTHRMLGIRADMTPQIARLDAHYLSDNDINRLCYAGTVLRTQPDQMGGQRELLQIGAEVFGVTEQSADIEIVDAMLAALALSGAQKLTLSLSHVGIYRELLALGDFASSLEADLFDALLRKSAPDLELLLESADVSTFQNLLSLQGGASVIDLAADTLPKTAAVEQSLAELKSVVAHVQAKHKHIHLHIDLADVFGYDYHTGLKYAAYIEGRGRTIAKGGRYDRIGEHFGHARPATGFSADLKSLNKLR